MNLLADENVDRQIVEQLRLDGHDVLYIAEFEPSISDNIVFDRANERSALLLTEDKDFGEIVFRDGHLSSGGVVLLRWRVCRLRKRRGSCLTLSANTN